MTITITDALNKVPVRIGTTIYIPGVVASSGGTPQALADFFAEVVGEEKNTARLKAQLPELQDILDEDPANAEQLANYLFASQVDGFFVRAETPDRLFIGTGPRSDWSWNAYSSVWLYAANQDDIHQIAIEWAKDRHDKLLEAYREQRKAKSSPTS